MAVKPPSDSGHVASGRSRDGGMTLVEVMVALSLFTMLSAGVLAMFLSSFQSTRSDRSRVAAAQLAARELEIVRDQFGSPSFGPKTVTLGQVVNPDPLPGGTAGQPLVVDKVPYTVTRSAQWQSQGATAGPCDGGASGQLAYLHVTVTVSWPRMSGVTPVTNSTLLTPPLGTYDTGTGHVKVKVTDAAGAPVPGQVVTLSPQGSQQTSSDGCAFFAFLTPGNYTASLNTPGYVDPSWSSSPSQPVTVTANSIAPVAFAYAPAATLNLAPTVIAGYPAPAAMGFTVYNTALTSTTHTKPIPAGAGGQTSLTVWPYADGLTAWAGDCADADPQVSGGSRQAPFATGAAQTTNAAVAASPVTITVRTAAGAAVTGATVVAVHVADSGCPGPVADPVDGGNAGEVFTAPATTDSSGAARVALPAGSWTFKVSGRVASTAWPSSTLNASATPVAVTVTVR